MSKINERPLPLELTNLYDEMRAAQEVRDCFVNVGFLRKAIKAATVVVIKRGLFWRRVEELYPLDKNTTSNGRTVWEGEEDKP